MEVTLSVSISKWSIRTRKFELEQEISIAASFAEMKQLIIHKCHTQDFFLSITGRWAVEKQTGDCPVLLILCSSKSFEIQCLKSSRIFLLRNVHVLWRWRQMEVELFVRLHSSVVSFASPLTRIDPFLQSCEEFFALLHSGLNIQKMAKSFTIIASTTTAPSPTWRSCENTNNSQSSRR